MIEIKSFIPRDANDKLIFSYEKITEAIKVSSFAKEFCSVIMTCFCSGSDEGYLPFPLSVHCKKEGGKIVAVGLLTPNLFLLPEKHKNRKNSLYVTDICTLPEYRKRGFCKEIMNSIINDSKNIGAKTLILDVKLEDMVVYNIYKSLGFSEIDRYTEYLNTYVIMELVL